MRPALLVRNCILLNIVKFVTIYVALSVEKPVKKSIVSRFALLPALLLILVTAACDTGQTTPTPVPPSTPAPATPTAQAAVTPTAASSAATPTSGAASGTMVHIKLGYVP